VWLSPETRGIAALWPRACQAGLRLEPELALVLETGGVDGDQGIGLAVLRPGRRSESSPLIGHRFLREAGPHLIVGVLALRVFAVVACFAVSARDQEAFSRLSGRCGAVRVSSTTGTPRGEFAAGVSSLRLVCELSRATRSKRRCWRLSTCLQRSSAGRAQALGPVPVPYGEAAWL
jgi:hypothetical protein